jgi:hypothetical protein
MINRRLAFRFLPLGPLALALACSAGCATPCGQIAQHRDAFRAAQAAPTAEPHLVAAIPMGLVNQLIAPQVASITSLPLQVPGLGLLEPFLSDLQLRPREVTVVAAQGPGVGLDLVLEVTQGGQPLFTMTGRGVLQPQLDPATGRVALELRPSDFQSIEPRLEPDAANRLAGSLYGLIPSMARLVISEQTIASMAGMVTQVIATQGYALLRDSLFAQLGPLARVEVALPNLPITQMEFSSHTTPAGDQLVLRAMTSLPVRAGVSSDQTPSPGPQETELWLSGQVMAQLANWAMAGGQLPSRFDEHGEPSERGVFEAGMDWGSGDRPLIVHVWRLEPRCLRATLSATPELRVEGDDIVLEVLEPRVEELEGPPAPGLYRLFSGTWLRAMNRTQSTAASLELAIGGRPLHAQVTAARRVGDLIQLTLRLAEGAATPAGPSAASGETGNGAASAL